MAKLFISVAALFGLSGVALGAFGVHALQNRLSPNALSAYETAVQYQFLHALGLLGIGILCLLIPPSRLLHSSGWAMTSGIVFFSGSLYVLALSEFKQIGIIKIGLLTPFGGLLFIVGWLLLLLTALTKINS